MSYRDAAFSIDEIEVFLRAVDRHLTRPARIVILGGGAAAFHTTTATTMDLDTFEALDDDLRVAIVAATHVTGMQMPVGHASIADIPYDAEDRFERRLPDLEWLQVWVLEKHDLVLSKILRFVNHDEEQIVELHRAVGLDYDVLVERFRDEMSHVMGNPSRIRAQFLQMIDRLFGERRTTSADQTLKARGR